MDKLRTDSQPTGSLQSMSLAQLCGLPLEDRCAKLLGYGREWFELALEVLRRARAPSTMDAERLAWAVAFNLDKPPISDAAAGGSPRGGGGYRARWPADTAWPVVWSVLVRPLMPDAANPSPTFLSELALSVACEQREEWQNPASRPLDLAAANRTFEFVYAQNKMKVLGVCRRFADGAGDPEAIADEAWSRVFCDYWSTQARRRFLGLCRISTLVSQVARFVAIDMLRDRQRFVPDSDGNNLPDDVLSLEEIGIVIDPLENLAAERLRARVKDCVSGLPARQQIVAEMVWFRGISAKRAAEILGVSEPAISQHLKKARDRMRACLGGPEVRIIQ